MQNLETGNGLTNTVSRGAKALFRWLGGEKNQTLTIENRATQDNFPHEEWFIMDGTDIFAGPYKTEGAAKGQLTRYLKGYTPASRRPL